MIDKIAWSHVVNGRILSTRSRGKDVYYLPGGKREPGESDVETLVREIHEELDVAITPESVAAAGTRVRMTCYTAEYRGTLKASSEIEELAWLGYADRDRATHLTCRR